MANPRADQSEKNKNKAKFFGARGKRKRLPLFFRFKIICLFLSNTIDTNNLGAKIKMDNETTKEVDHNLKKEETT